MQKRIKINLAVLILGNFFSITVQAGWNYTVLDAEQYQQIVKQSRAKVQQLLHTLQPHRRQDANKQIAILGQELADTPYIYNGAVGEGDWQPTSLVYQPGAVHIVQNPVYRFDGFDCQSFVEVVMAILHAKSLDEFDRDILKISYGAAGNPNGEIVRYYNRNHFVDGDFNPVNQGNGWLTDVTTHGELASHASMTSAMITRQRWFLFQQQNLHDHVHVLNDADGSAMVHRFRTVYSALKFPRFNAEKVAITYIPKTLLAMKQNDGSYAPNTTLLDSIPTPSVVEIVRDVKKWGRGRAKDLIGSELNISHFGVLYRQTFKPGELIYQKITCQFASGYEKICHVTPITCEQKQCKELMFMHATDAYPKGYYWYQQANGNFVCTANPPALGQAYSQCNRVERLPFFRYVADYQFGFYWYLDIPSILGFHFEKLSGLEHAATN